MEKTKNYKLTKWALTDRIEMQHFNDDNDAIEAALTGLDGKINSARSSLDSKIDTTKTGLESKISSSQTGLDSKFDAAVSDLNSRKLETVTLVDKSTTLKNAQSWEIPLDGLNLGEYLALFIEIEAPTSVSMKPNPNGQANGLTTGRAAFLCVPARFPEKYIVYLSTSSIQGTLSGGCQYSKIESFTLTASNSNYPMTGDFRFRIIAIP